MEEIDVDVKRIVKKALETKKPGENIEEVFSSEKSRTTS